MASTTGLVPITRSFLAKFYDKYPFEPLTDKIPKLKEQMISISDELDAERADPDGTPGVVAELAFEVPHKIDENFWKNREQIEEILYLLDEEHWPAELGSSEALAASTSKWKQELQDILEVIQTYQKMTSDKVSSMVFTYLPQDFRGMLLKQQKERSEVRRQAEVANLIASGGSIKQKYALLWQQQMDRRKSLAALGSATGIYATLMTYLVGVPQVLLDFVKTINDHDGPMEEQRLRYGPSLYDLTSFVNRTRILLAAWWSTFDKHTDRAPELSTLVDESITVYCTEFKRFLKTLGDVFENSPFLISAEDAMSEEDQSKAAAFKEITVANGYKQESLLTVDAVGSLVAWEFSLTLGKDVGFSVEYEDENGVKTGLFPYQRLESHQGSFNAPGVGSYRVIWDNSYSYINRKTIRYKLDVIPPMETEAQLAEEESLAHAADKLDIGSEKEIGKTD